MENILYQDLQHINHTYWNFLHKEWGIKVDKYKHRSEIKEIKFIMEIKDELYKKLGYISVFYFLNEIFIKYDYKCPYNTLEKGLLILYHIVSGKSMREMNVYMAYTSFHEIYKQFWENNRNELNKIVKNLLENMFSCVSLRINSANNNPINFKHVTLFMDGHDSRIDYLNKNISKEDMYSFKFKKSGVRTQVISDMNEIILFVSDSMPCKNYNDGKMFLNMGLENRLIEYDCIGFDGGYNFYIEEFIEKCSKYGNDKINSDNFIFPIRKQKNILLSESEKLFNDTFGSFRSSIENVFGKLQNKFKRFDNTTTTLKIGDIKIYNLQFKLACLLYNIKKFTEKENILSQSHHMLWTQSDFNYPNPNKIIENEVIYTFESFRINNMLNKQRYFMENIIGINDNTLNDEMEQDDNIYDVEYIINHRKYKNRIKYLVKWKNYDETQNSWKKLIFRY
ncbi:unnamed protein product [Mucor hiemalis]